MNMKKMAAIAAIASMGLLVGACDKADDRDLAQTTDSTPTYKDTTPSTPTQSQRPVNANTTRSSTPANGAMQKSNRDSRGNIDVGDIEGKELVGANGEELGDVDRIVIDRKTGKKMAVIGLKGLVGDGAKEVLVPLEQIRMSMDDDKVVTNLSKEALEARPDVDMGDFTELEDRDY